MILQRKPCTVLMSLVRTGCSRNFVRLRYVISVFRGRISESFYFVRETRKGCVEGWERGKDMSVL